MNVGTAASGMDLRIKRSMSLSSPDSSDETREIALPVAPARPVRPMRCT